MSSLSLTKQYGDLTLMFAADVHDMWTELETKTNGNIDSDNVNTGWATWSQVTLAKDTDFGIGVTPSHYMYMKTSDNELVFANITTQRDFYFKLGGTTYGTLDTSSNLLLTKDIMFYNKNTTYPLSYLIGYAKPVLVYYDDNSINVEQNTTTAARTLIVFPTGPIAVTEDTTSTHKFRQLKLDATANGYSGAHTGAADSGLKSGLSLTANTWYFVYAVVVQGGDDASNDNFILVVDDTNPTPSNWGTLDSRYTAGNWVYLGLFRYGFGTTLDTSIIPFVQDHSGWHMFTSRAATDNFFGIKTAEVSVTSTSYATLETFTAANSGDAAPANCNFLRIAYRITGPAEMNGNFIITDGSDNVLWDLPSFAVNLEVDEPHGWSFIIPNVGLKLKAKTGT